MGSPPPMRGKGGKCPAGTGYDRITPAYAGKSGQGQGGFCGVEDHPRLCGEKSDTADEQHWKKGSPPPMRGKGESMHYTHAVCGITPAYAGKSVLPCHWLFRVRDHPRLCGEKANANFSNGYIWGSPPPMRGKD